MSLGVLVKRFCLTAILLLIIYTPFSVQALSEVQSLSVELEVRSDGALYVVEEYELNRLAFTDAEFTRFIPLTHPLPNPSWAQERYVTVVVDETLVNGTTVTAREEEREDGLAVVWSLPESGTTTALTLAYTLQGRLSHLESGAAELVWNATEGMDEYGFRQLSARVYSNQDILIPGRTCVTGIEGEMISCSSEVGDDFVEYTGRIVAPGVEFSLSQSLHEAKIVPIENVRPKPWILPAAIVFLVLVILWIIMTNKKKQREDELDELRDALDDTAEKAVIETDHDQRMQKDS